MLCRKWSVRTSVGQWVKFIELIASKQHRMSVGLRFLYLYDPFNHLPSAEQSWCLQHSAEGNLLKPNIIVLNPGRTQIFGSSMSRD